MSKRINTDLSTHYRF